jgi:hypothetical protein
MERSHPPKEGSTVPNFSSSKIEYLKVQIDQKCLDMVILYHFQPGKPTERGKIKYITGQIFSHEFPL